MLYGLRLTAKHSERQLPQQLTMQQSGNPFASDSTAEGQDIARAVALFLVSNELRVKKS